MQEINEGHKADCLMKKEKKTLSELFWTGESQNSILYFQIFYN